MKKTNEKQLSDLEVLEQVILIEQEANRLTAEEMDGDKGIQMLAAGFEEACKTFLNVIAGLKNNGGDE